MSCLGLALTCIWGFGMTVTCKLYNLVPRTPPSFWLLTKAGESWERGYVSQYWTGNEAKSQYWSGNEAKTLGIGLGTRLSLSTGLGTRLSLSTGLISALPVPR